MTDDPSRPHPAPAQLRTPVSPTPKGLVWKHSHEFFVDLIRRVAPERQSEIDALVQNHRLRFVADEQSRHPRFQTNLATGQVSISTEPIYILWFHAWAYLRAYDGVHRARTADPSVRKVFAGADATLAVALDTLRWAVETDLDRVKAAHDGSINGEEGELPAASPLPFDRNQRDAFKQVADDLTLMALGWILFHEIAHVTLSHQPQPSDIAASHRQEKEADSWAADFVLQHVDKYCRENHPHNPRCGELVRLKRQEAIIVALLWLVKFECHFGVRADGTHPPTYDRLFRLLSEFADDPNHLVWAFASVVLGMHMQAAGMTPSDKEFVEYRELVSHQCDVLSRVTRP